MQKHKKLYWEHQSDEDTYWIFVGKTMRELQYVWREASKGDRVFYQCVKTREKVWKLPKSGLGKGNQNDNMEPDLLNYKGGEYLGDKTKKSRKVIARPRASSAVNRNFHSGITRQLSPDSQSPKRLATRQIVVPEDSMIIASSCKYEEEQRRLKVKRRKRAAKKAAIEQVLLLDECLTSDSDSEAERQFIAGLDSDSTSCQTGSPTSSMRNIFRSPSSSQKTPIDAASPPASPLQSPGNQLRAHRNKLRHVSVNSPVQRRDSVNSPKVCFLYNRCLTRF